MTDHVTAQVDRPFPRLSRQGKVEYRIIEDLQDAMATAGVPSTQIQNICGGGIRFTCQEFIEPGIFLAVRIELPDLPDTILALGRVVSCEPPTAVESRHELSVEFFWTGWGAPEVESAIHRCILHLV